MLSNGIRLELGRTVSRILVKGGRAAGVELEGSDTLPAAVVIANADAPQVQAMLLPRTARSERRVDRMDYSMGLFVLCFGTNRAWPQVAHHTIIFGERWRALLDEIFDGADLPRDPSLYLHRPAATDPSLQPPGNDGFYVLAPVPNLRSRIDWNSAAPLLRDRIVPLLESRVFPGPSRHIVTEHVMTPLDFAHDYLSRHNRRARLFRKGASASKRRLIAMLSIIPPS